MPYSQYKSGLYMYTRPQRLVKLLKVLDEMRK